MFKAMCLAAHLPDVLRIIFPGQITLRLSSGCGTASKRRNSPQDGVRKGWLVGPGGTPAGQALEASLTNTSRESSREQGGSDQQ